MEEGDSLRTPWEIFENDCRECYSRSLSSGKEREKKEEDEEKNEEVKEEESRMSGRDVSAGF